MKYFHFLMDIWKYFILCIYALMCFKHRIYVCKEHKLMKEKVSHNFHYQIMGWKAYDGEHGHKWITIDDGLLNALTNLLLDFFSILTTCEVFSCWFP
jgi:hypothetical protein